jgi:hypothetical protein
MHARLRCVVGAVLLAAVACDGIGREVVDHQMPLPPGILSTVCEPPSCDTPARSIELRPEIATRVHEPDRNTCPDTFDACALEPSTGDASPTACAQGQLDEPARLAHQVLRCAELELVLPVVQGECSFTLEGLVLEHTTLRLRAGAPCAVSMPALSTNDARIELEGPVVLILEQRAELQDTSFVGTRTAAGAPLLELDLIEGARVAIGDEALPFAGAVHALHTRLVDSSLHSEEIALDSVLFGNVKLHSGDLHADDAVFDSAILELDNADFSAASLANVEVRTCGAMRIAGSGVQSSVLRRCGDELVRIYNSTVAKTDIEGSIESDSSDFESVRFGMQEPTDVAHFGGTMHKTAFCGATRGYRAGELAGTSCVRCNARGTFEPDGACWVSKTSAIGADRTDCPAFQMLPECSGEGPAPRRPRWPSAASL